MSSMHRLVETLESERQQLRRATDGASQVRLAKVDSDLDQLYKLLGQEPQSGAEVHSSLSQRHSMRTCGTYEKVAMDPGTPGVHRGSPGQCFGN